MSVIAVDVDGTVADLLSQWLKWYNEKWDDTLKPSQITEWGIQEFVKPEARDRIFDFIEMAEAYYYVTPITGALDGIQTLREAGHRIVYATSSTVGASGAKWTWLVNHGFVSNLDDYMEVRDKSLIHADFLIDDGYHNLQRFGLSRHRQGILFVQPWNNKKFWPLKIKGGWKKLDLAVLEG